MSQAGRALNPPTVPRASRQTRTASRTAYEGLRDAAAVALARSMFNVQQPIPVSPLTQPGVRVTRSINDFTAVVAAGQTRSVVVSSLPLRARDRKGARVPASLELESRADAFVPKAPLVPVRIAKNLHGGFSLPGGVQVFPSAPRGSTARKLGQAAFFANSDIDTDALVRATPLGAEALWQVRSRRSPEVYRLRFALPTRAARLEMSADIPGGAEVVDGKAKLFTIPPPAAQDADGHPVAVTMRVSGKVLVVTVRHRTLSAHYPILVDPP